MSNAYPSNDPDVNREDQQAARAVKSLPRPALAPSSVEKIERQALQRLRKQKQRAFQFPQFHSFPRLAIALSIVLALILATSGTVAASAGSLPGEPLYGVKRLTEKTELLFAPADQQATIHAAHAETRLSEIQKLAAKGVILPGLLTEMQAEMQAAVSGAKTLPAKQQAGVLSAIVGLTIKQETALSNIQAQLPPAHASQSDLIRAQSNLTTQRQDVITYAEKLSIPLTVHATPTATATKQPATSTSTSTAQFTATHPTLTPTPIQTRAATATPQPTATPRPPTQTSVIVPTQQSTQAITATSGATNTPPGQSGNSNAGGNPNNNAGGNPNNNAGGNPNNNAGGNPNNNAGGNPDNNAGGNPDNNAGGNPNNNAGGGGGKKP